MPGLSGPPNGPIGGAPSSLYASDECGLSLTGAQETSSREQSTKTGTSRMLHFQLGLNSTSRQRSTSPRELGVTSWSAFINCSRRQEFPGPGDTRFGIWTTCQGFLLKAREIAAVFMILTWDICIKGPKGFALVSITLSFATFV